MTVRSPRGTRPSTPQDLLDSLRGAPVPEPLERHEIPSPHRMGDESLAFSAEVPGDEEDHPAATGRFVVLHDAQEPPEWGGAWRVVTFVGARVEPELATDPFVADVAWSWLTDALAAHEADHEAASGTVTTVVSTGFGEREAAARSVELEVRASWTPVAELENHLAAWQELVLTTAGQPPMPEGVVPLRPGRS